MEQVIRIYAIGLLILIPLTSLLLLVSALFPHITNKAKDVIENSQGRTFLVGVVNLLFLAAILIISIFLVENVGLPPIFFIPALAAVFAFAAGTLVGITSVTHVIGERILPEHTQPQRNIRAAVVLVLALLTPFIGWYIFFPYIAILGFGGFVAATIQKRRANRTSRTPKENDE
ncbi:MAG: hypothetical protein IH859_02910 [Chloroflexi bacterium]|nr:hypothetical protein [Chloroflexota bacterium]